MAICFEEEREWRLILNSFPKWKEIKVGDMSFTEPTYRVSKGQLISYVELSFANVKSDFVKEIWIGPKSKIELRDIKHVLSRYGYYDEVDDYITPAVKYRRFYLLKFPSAALSSIVVALATTHSSALQMKIYSA